jgi:hypothetical protein
MSADELAACVLCGDPIADGEAWLTTEVGERAHSGCVYRDTDADDRDRWMAPEAIA